MGRHTEVGHAGQVWKGVTKLNDPYYAMVEEQWSNILALYDHFEYKNPIMILDIQEQRIYCYPYEDFKATLSLKDQLLLEDMHRRTLENSNIIVFVRDNDERRLVSYSVNPGDPRRKYPKKRSMRVKSSQAVSLVHPVGDPG